MAIRGWGQTYLPRVSISRSKAMGLGSPELSFAMSLEESNGGLLTKTNYGSVEKVGVEPHPKRVGPAS